jgi:hypothetical protein
MLVKRKVLQAAEVGWPSGRGSVNASRFAGEQTAWSARVGLPRASWFAEGELVCRGRGGLPRASWFAEGEVVGPAGVFATGISADSFATQKSLGRACDASVSARCATQSKLVGFWGLVEVNELGRGQRAWSRSTSFGRGQRAWSRSTSLVEVNELGRGQRAWSRSTSFGRGQRAWSRSTSSVEVNELGRGQRAWSRSTSLVQCKGFAGLVTLRSARGCGREVGWGRGAWLVLGGGGAAGWFGAGRLVPCRQGAWACGFGPHVAGQSESLVAVVPAHVAC